MSIVSEIVEIEYWKIGQRIQNKRIEKGLSGAELGAYLDVSANQISRIENGRAKCTIEHLFVLAQVLDCSADYLLYGKEDVPSYTKEQVACIDALVASFRK